MGPIILLVVGVLNFKVVLLLFGTFQVFYQVANAVLMLLALGFGFNDGRAAGCLFCAPSFFLASFMDAAPHGRKHALTVTAFFSLNFMGLVLLQVLIQQDGLFEDVAMTIGRRDFSSLNFASTANLNLCVLVVRNFWTAHVLPPTFLRGRARRARTRAPCAGPAQLTVPATLPHVVCCNAVTNTPTAS